MALVKITDTLTPDIRRRISLAGDKRPLLAAMGQAVRTLSVQAFTDPAKRPQYWAPRKDDKPHALLQKSTLLRKSIRVLGYTGQAVLIGSDRPYAATHQFGRDAIPARPYMPFYASGQMTSLGRQRTERALVAALRARGW